METKDKELLLTDLSARLKYGVILHWEGEQYLVKLYGIKTYGKTIDEYTFIGLGQPEPGYEYSMRIGDIKPYLRRMSDMTEEEMKEYHAFFFYDGVEYPEEYIDWLNAHHFDYRRLIDKGLALVAPKGMYNI